MITIVVAAMLLAACGTDGGDPAAPEDGAAPANGDEVLRIGLVTPLSGPSSAYGQDSQQAAQLAVDIANSEGWFDGATIELLVEDDHGVPEEAAVALQTVLDEGAEVIIGTMNSSVAVALGNALGDRDDILYVVSGAQAQDPLDAQEHGNIFGMTHTNAMYGESYHPWISEVAQPRRVAVLAENTDFGVNDLAALEENWGDGDPEIVLREFFEREETDYSGLLASVRASDADAIYLVGAGPTIPASLFRQADEVGLDVQKFMNAGNMSPELLEEGGEAIEGLHSADIYHHSLDHDASREFVELFEERYGTEPSPIHTLVWESVLLPLQAADEVGSFDVLAVADTLRSGSWRSPRGELTFDDTGRAHTSSLIMRVSDGQYEVVEVVD